MIQLISKLYFQQYYSRLHGRVLQHRESTLDRSGKDEADTENFSHLEGEHDKKSCLRGSHPTSMQRDGKRPNLKKLIAMRHLYTIDR